MWPVCVWWPGGCGRRGHGSVALWQRSPHGELGDRDGPADPDRPTAWGDLVRPVLRPGLHVVRRDDRHLQLGLDPPDRLVLPDRPGLRDALTRLDRRPPAELRDVVDQLVRDGWVVDAEPPAPATTRRRAPVALTVDAVLEQHGAPRLRRGAPGATPAASARASWRRSASLVGRSPTPWSATTLPHLWLAVLPGSRPDRAVRRARSHGLPALPRRPPGRPSTRGGPPCSTSSRTLPAAPTAEPGSVPAPARGGLGRARPRPPPRRPRPRLSARRRSP